eukprot:gene44490-biopygen37844
MIALEANLVQSAKLLGRVGAPVPRCPKPLPPMPLSDLIGYLAATLTTCSFLPQALHTFRTRDVSGISLGMYSVFTSGVALA